MRPAPATETDNEATAPEEVTAGPEPRWASRGGGMCETPRQLPRVFGGLRPVRFCRRRSPSAFPRYTGPQSAEAARSSMKVAAEGDGQDWLCASSTFGTCSGHTAATSTTILEPQRARRLALWPSGPVVTQSWCRPSLRCGHHHYLPDPAATRAVQPEPYLDARADFRRSLDAH
jgi:hypothetical protein